MEANTFTLRLRLGNDAMQTYADLARSLHELASVLDRFRGAPLVNDAGAICDDNGNRVGGWHASNEEA